jgi:hypothetical protein
VVVVVWVSLGMKGDLVCDKGKRTRRQALDFAKRV